MVKAVHNELVRILGGTALRVTYAPRPPTVVLLAGLQGAGKTTNAAKLARWFKQQGRNPLLVAADLQRPAAVEQLRVLGRQVGVPVFSEDSGPGDGGQKRPGRSGAGGPGRAHRGHGRSPAHRHGDDGPGPGNLRDGPAPLHVPGHRRHDRPGRGTTAEAFHKTLQLDGVILTKVDGDARGGAALSVKEVVGRPIAFASTGEKLEDFELFHPDRMAGRILGMGDVLTLIDRAETAIKQDDAEKAVARMAEGRFTSGGLPGAIAGRKEDGPALGLDRDAPDGPEEVRNMQLDDGMLKPVEAIIHSMTPAERADPSLINGSRRTAHRRRLGYHGAGRQRPARPVQAGTGVHAHGPGPGRDVAPERGQEGGGQAQEAALRPCAGLAGPAPVSARLDLAGPLAAEVGISAPARS